MHCHDHTLSVHNNLHWIVSANIYGEEWFDQTELWPSLKPDLKLNGRGTTRNDWFYYHFFWPTKNCCFFHPRLERISVIFQSIGPLCKICWQFLWRPNVMKTADQPEYCWAHCSQTYITTARGLWGFSQKQLHLLMWAFLWEKGKTQKSWSSIDG